MGERPVEISLSPEELGRVRMTMSPGDGGLTLTIVAEREETLTLLRRHMDMLGAELRDLGFLNLTFRFARNGGGQSGQSGHPHASGGSRDIAQTPDPDPVARPSGGPASARLDIRL